MLNKKSFAHFRVTVKFGDQGKSQHEDMKFCNWGPTIIWHNIESVAFFLSKSLHPSRQHLCGHSVNIEHANAQFSQIS